MSVTFLVSLRYLYSTYPFNTTRENLGQRRRRLSRTDDKRTNFKAFLQFVHPLDARSRYPVRSDTTNTEYILL